ncbi:L,D-transpeptidase [Nitrosomonas sp. JL21]|uniref:L,D-transpeptidase n=1 Tax=Nitrosomonas sp. JL21 TaxID=153949 RepID=UPI0031F38DB5
MIKQILTFHYWKFLLIGLCGLSSVNSVAQTDDSIWIDVDTSEHTLLVMQGEAVRVIFKNVAIGRYGTTWTKMTRDDKTPLGKFRVGWVNEKSRYYRFYGLNYPNLDTAKRALDDNRIDEETWLSILEAKNMGKTPPQDTPLGGHIGIHGIGRGDQEIHHQYNWTNGCIALTNEQIDQLGKWIKPGILVNIR